MRITKQSSCPAPSVRGDAGGGMTGNESFVTVNDDTATLPNSRQLAAGANISVTDGGAGNPITVAYTGPANTKVESEQCLMAGDFVPSQSPFIPAPIENYYIAANGSSGKAIKLVPGGASAAGIWFSNRWIAKPGTAFYIINAHVNAFTDNADIANTFSVRLHHYSSSIPAAHSNS